MEGDEERVGRLGICGEEDRISVNAINDGAFIGCACPSRRACSVSLCVLAALLSLVGQSSGWCYLQLARRLASIKHESLNVLYIYLEIYLFGRIAFWTIDSTWI